MNRIVCMFLLLAMIVSLAGCAGPRQEATPAAVETPEPTAAAATPVPAEPTPETPEETPAPEEEENPWVGIWACGRATIEIVKLDEEYKCSIFWPSSAAERTFWAYDCYEDDMGALYSFETGVKTNLVWASDTEIASEEVVYTDGAVRLTINEAGKLIWEDFKEDVGQGMEFERESVVGIGPTAEELAEGYFRVVNSFMPGTSGSSLAMAKAACEVYSFAYSHGLWYTDVPALRDNLLTAWESLSQDEQAAFDANFLAVSELLENCARDWDGSRGLFDDAGVADSMQAMRIDPMAEVSWVVLRNYTLTMGNSVAP